MPRGNGVRGPGFRGLGAGGCVARQAVRFVVFGGVAVALIGWKERSVREKDRLDAIRALGGLTTG